MDKTECKNCFHFKEYWSDPWSGNYSPAACKHPFCFEEVEYQDDYGYIKTKCKRIKDIIDFNKDGCCSHFDPYYYEKKKLWWIFNKRVKMKGFKCKK